MNKSKFIYLTLSAIFMSSSLLIAQDLTWTGSVDNDFYNEQNWIIAGTENAPAAGTLVAGTPITSNLNIANASLEIGDMLDFDAPDKSIELKGASLSCAGILTGSASLNEQSTLIFNDATPLGNNASVDIKDPLSWVKLIKVNPVDAEALYLSKITSAGNALSLNEGIRINQYYFKGSLIRLLDAGFAALKLYDGQGLSGTSFEVREFDVYSDEQLGDFNNMASSFRLERGYLAVLAIYQNGKGKSQCYVASEEALEIDLTQALNNSISFIRVMPWNWVTKKGVSGHKEGLNASWTYNWGNGAESLPNMEYAPMSWGTGGATTEAVFQQRAKKQVTHMMGFNESDNCNDQSGQYGGLCQIEVAVPAFGNLRRVGLRMVSPSPRENGPFTWLKDFRDEARNQDVSYDVLGVHWYDWGGNPVNTPFEDPEKIFTRFKNYLDRVYKEHGLPIWLTEFNANPNRDASVQLGFLQLALPYLESLDYIERYDYFVPMPSVAGDRDDIEFGKFFDEQDNITPLGIFYRDFESTPSLPEATWVTPTFLNDMDSKIAVYLEVEKDTLAEGDFMKLRVHTERAVGAPQQVTILIQNISDDQYTIRETVLTIEEGASEAETIIQATDDDEVEDNVTVTISLSDLSDGIIWSGTAASFILTSEDVKIIPLGVAQHRLQIYPNPVKGNLQIRNQPQDIIDIHCVAMNGQTFNLDKSMNGTYDVSHIPTGLYAIRLSTVSKGVLVGKLVIK